MRIVQFVNNLDVGGIERLAVDLAYCQKTSGHEAVIYCLTHRGRFAAEAEAAGARIVAFEKSKGPSVPVVWNIVKELRRDRPDVLHTHNHLVHHYGVLAGKLAGVPLIVNTRHRAEMLITARGPGYIVNSESPDRKADLIYRAGLPWTDAVVMISEATRKFLVKHRGVPMTKTKVILNGAPLERFFRFPASPGSKRPRIRFGTAARMVPDKDHFTLLTAFAQVARTLPDAELRIAGDGPLRSRVESMIQELNLAERVCVVGMLDNMAEYMAGLDIFVLASLNEGLPIAILEAMAAGLPIVSTRVGGVAEAAVEGRNARFVEPGDAEGLAREMIDMARCPHLAQIGAESRELVDERFLINRTWSQYEQLFERLRSERQ